MATYSSLLRERGVAPLLLSQLVARMPAGMLVIELLIHIQLRLGTYAAAGLVVAAFSIGAAVNGPLAGRMMGRLGIRGVLITTVAVSTVALASVALLTMPLPAYLGVGLLMGLFTPPVQPAVRTIYPKIVRGDQLNPLFSLDAAAQEIIWIVGPLLATFMATQIGSAQALLITAALGLIGGAWLVTVRVVGQVRIPPSRRQLGVVLRRPAILVAVVVGGLMLGGFGAVEAATVAAFGSHGLEAGLILALMSAGSLAGGVFAGGFVITPWSLTRRLLVVGVGIAVASAWMNAWWIGAWLIVCGLGFSPAMAAIAAIVSSSVKFSDTAEAFGWAGSGQLLGGAMGTFIGGVAIDTTSPQLAYAAGAGLTMLGVLGAATFIRALPDLKTRMGPLPDTGTIPVVR